MLLLSLFSRLLLGESINYAFQTDTVVYLIFRESFVLLHLFLLGLKHCSELVLQLAQPLILRPILVYGFVSLYDPRVIEDAFKRNAVFWVEDEDFANEISASWRELAWHFVV